MSKRTIFCKIQITPIGVYVKIIICGAGEVGKSLIRYLSLDYEIVVIDIDGKVLESIQNHYDVQVICGNAADINILKKAKIQPTSAIVAVTGNDEINIVACQLSHYFFNVQLKTARLRNESYFQDEFVEAFKQNFKIDLIFYPEYDAALSIMQSFHAPYAFDTFFFADGKLILIGIQIDNKSSLAKKTIEQIQEELSAFDFKIIRIIRNYLAFIPNKNEEIAVNDALYFLVSASQSQDIMSKLGYPNDKSTAVIIFGASVVSRFIIEKFFVAGRAVTVIEEDPEKIKKIAPFCPGVSFLNGSPLNPDVLREANVNTSGYAIAATSDDTVNILVALMAHSYGVDHSIVLMQKIGYLSPLFALGVEKMIHPSQLIISSLLQKLTKDYVVSFYPLEGEYNGTVIEAIIKNESKVVGRSSESINDDLIQVLGVVRENKIIWEDVILAVGDHVMLTTLSEGYYRFQKLFSYL